MSESKLTFPIIHLNGTSANSLLEGYRDAAHCLYDCIALVQKTGPHGRDYYVSKDPQALEKATQDHRARLEKLASVLEDLQELAIHVQKQENERKRR